MVHQTAEESKRRYQDEMGEKLGSAYYVLFSDLSHLFEKWGDYVSLFGTDADTVELLNRSAPEFFGRYQSVMEADITLHLARLEHFPPDVDHYP